MKLAWYIDQLDACHWPNIEGVNRRAAGEKKKKTNKIWHEIKKVYTLKSHNNSSKNGIKVEILFNVTLKVSRNKYMEKERRRVYAAHVGHKWNLTHIFTTPILFVYHKIRVSMNGRVEGISKKPAKHGIELTIFLHFNIT